MRQQFAHLTSFLCQYQGYWRHDPFLQVTSGEISWSALNPELEQWIQQLSSKQTLEYKSSLELCLKELECFFPGLEATHQSITLMPLESGDDLELPRGLDAGIPGRKLTQIQQMTKACLHGHQGSEWLEWCSGKGFLGRLLSSQSNQHVTSFEFQHSLCESGQLDADKLGLPMEFVQGDAFDEAAAEVFNDKQHAVALHACGDLHVTLIEHAVEQHLPAVTLSPCCYHLVRGEHYSPLSDEGKRAGLALSKHELRIPLQETVTGGERVKRHREQEMSYRLGFDALCKELGLSVEYLPVPSIKKSQLASGFKAFCLWAGEKKSFTIPEVDFERFEKIGEERFWAMEALSLVQGVFRRPLEVWLAMDKALYLESKGYQVTLSTFCEVETTPRNILIHAARSNNQK
ncbi:methyltransferase [Vibrio sp. SCSIO 43140]|uniref:methyltransferase n=1 Tax=Vibrio sp. SCSIO 43140 TaxID=2819100 RepID=UPI0020750034|nr:methyltransferase [Vibrio sp. SCSIO 43140]USD61458.1 methyltransferase [Vibrio sp. SCSIO 43140]